MTKKQNTGGAKPAATPDLDLKTLIHGHSLFFDHLVELIPARFYLPSHDEDKTPFKFLSKREKVAARKQTRKNLKKARRVRLDPDKSTTTLDLLHKSIDKEASFDDDGTVNPDDRPVTYEELKHRLHSRIEALRSTRNTRPENHNKKGSGPPREKRKRDEEAVDEKVKGKKVAKKAKVEMPPPPTDFTFSQVKIGGEGTEGRKKKKLSKGQELERAKRLEEAKKDPEKGGRVAEKHSWKAAVSRAAGEKVHDDPKLLKESIKKEKKRQQKHAVQWKERVESREKVRAEKQKMRSDNIKERIEDKKKRRIEKREKKLMRPGFEGRKEGFIN